MAAVVNGVSTASTSDTTSYAAAAFTPTANDFLLGMVVTSDTVAATPTLSDTQSLGWTLITSALWRTSASKIYLFAANALAAASSTTVTFDCTGDAATGAVVAVARVSGMTRTGSAAIRQTAKVENQTGPGVSPMATGTFGSACLTGNPTILFAGNTEAMNPPTNWTERAETSYATPTTFLQYSSRDSGFTGTSINWDDFAVSSSTYCDISIELDTSAASTSIPNKILAINQAIKRSGYY